MRNLLLFCMLISAPWSSAQIVLDTTDFPSAGDSLPVMISVLKPNQVSPGIFDTSQANFNFDLSDLTITERDTEVFAQPGTLVGGGDVPKAEFGYQTSDGVLFFAKDNSQMEIVGVGQQVQGFSLGFELDSAIEFIRAPLTYPYQHRDSAYTENNLGFASAKVGISSFYRVNGYGSITFPGDSTFEVLRIRRTLRFNSIFQILFPQPTTDTTVDSLVTWEFYAKEVKAPVLRITGEYETDNNDNIIDTNIYFTFYDYEKKTTVKRTEVEQRTERLYAAGDALFIENGKGAYMLSIYNLQGQLMEKREVHYQGQALNIQPLAKGMYVAQVTHLATGKQLTTQFWH